MFGLMLGTVGSNCETWKTSVIFLGKDNSELEMVSQTMYLRLHGW